MSYRQCSRWWVALLIVTIWGTGCDKNRAGDPAEAIAKGWTYYQLAEFDKAVDVFTSALKQTPATDKLHQQALFGLATTWNLRRPDENLPRARQYYSELLKLTPDGELTPWCLLALARMDHLVSPGEEPNYEAVRKAYQTVLDRFPNHPAADEAFLYQQATLIATLSPDDARNALAALEKYVAARPNSPFRSAYYGEMAYCCSVLRDWPRRLALEIRSLEAQENVKGMPAIDNAGTFWKIAAVAMYEVGDLATAEKFYQRLIAEYPKDMRVFAARQALANIADIRRGVLPKLTPPAAKPEPPSKTEAPR